MFIIFLIRHEVASILIFIFQMAKLRSRKVKKLTESHRSSKAKPNPGS